MANDVIKQIQIGSTVYDIDLANKQSVSVITGISGGTMTGKTTRYLHKSTTDVAPDGHTHDVTVSGTTGGNSGSAVTVATGSLNANGTGASVIIGASGTDTALTGVKVTSNPTITLTANGETASGRITYVESLSNTSFVTGISGGDIGCSRTTSGSGTTARRILEITHTAASVASSSAVSGTTKYLSASASGTAVGSNGTCTVITGLSASNMVLSSAAPNNHTHGYGSSTALTTTANSGTAVAAITGLSANTSSSTGDLEYIKSFTFTDVSTTGTDNAIKY